MARNFVIILHATYIVFFVYRKYCFTLQEHTTAALCGCPISHLLDESLSERLRTRRLLRILRANLRFGFFQVGGNLIRKCRSLHLNGNSGRRLHRWSRFVCIIRRGFKCVDDVRDFGGSFDIVRCNLHGRCRRCASIPLATKRRKRCGHDRVF